MAANVDRDRVLSIFERHRQSPGSAFDASHFLDFLLDHPRSRGAVRNSFAGLRRFNAFVQDVQLECAVCFSLNDLESGYSLDRFLARVDELRRSPKGSLASLRNQKRAGFGWLGVVLGNLPLVLIAWLLRHHALAQASWLVLMVLLNGWVAVFYWQSRRYIAALEGKLLALTGPPSPVRGQSSP